MNILKSLVVNPDMVSSDSNSIVIKPSESSSKVISKVLTSTSSTLPYYEYVIITDTSLVSGFTDFVNWKKRKGIDIGIVTTNDIYANYTGDLISNPNINDNSGKVRQYLKDAHSNGVITWALIAGDYNTNVPVKSVNFYGETVTTDSYFSDLAGNWSNNYPLNTPNIYVGRLICSSNSDVQNWSKKVILYEQNPGNGDYNYLLKSFSIQADQLQEGIYPYYSTYPPNQAGLVAAFFPSITPTIWGETPTAHSLYDGTGYSDTIMGSSKGADIIAELNTNHYALFSWFCHGGTGGKNSGIGTMTSGVNSTPYWKLDAEDANSYYNVQQESNNGLDNLDNANYPSLLYSVSCHVMPFNETSNIGNNGAMNCGEAYTNLPQTGGVAFLGNTANGYVADSYKIYESFASLINSDDYHSHLGVSDNISK